MAKEKITGAEALMRSLEHEGVTTLFGYPGGAIMPVYDALYGYKDKLNHVLVRHEQGATHAAQGYARVSGKVGVALVTSGPGATNTITGIADAMMDSTPIVVVAGQVGASLLGSDAFQECDLVGVTQPISKWAYQIRNSVDVSKMKEVINTAFSEYPAQSYGLVLWSHGEGWLAKSQNKTRWWGQDGGSNYMDISELKDVLRNAPHLSFLLFDACFMQSVEVVYELKEHADYIIGSPTEIPAPGAPYQKVVPAMFANNASATDIAKAYFEFYADENLYTGKLPYNWGLGAYVSTHNRHR